MRVRLRVHAPPLFCWQRRKREAEIAPAIDGPDRRLASLDSRERQPVISVTCSPGTLASGPTVAMGIKLADRRGLLVEMRMDEACDLANELLMAAQLSERKYEVKFGTG